MAESPSGGHILPATTIGFEERKDESLLERKYTGREKAISNTTAWGTVYQQLKVKDMFSKSAKQLRRSDERYVEKYLVLGVCDDGVTLFDCSLRSS